MTADEFRALVAHVDCGDADRDYVRRLMRPPVDPCVSNWLWEQGRLRNDWIIKVTRVASSPACANAGVPVDAIRAAVSQRDYKTALDIFTDYVSGRLD